MGSVEKINIGMRASLELIFSAGWPQVPHPNSTYAEVTAHTTTFSIIPHCLISQFLNMQFRNNLKRPANVDA